MVTARDFTLCAQTLQRASIRDRLDAAATAGFGSIGLTLAQYRTAGVSDRELLRLLDQHDLVLAEVEAPWDWAADDEQARSDGAAVLHIARTFGCTTLNVVQFVPHPAGLLLDRLGELCDAAGEAQVGLEFMPFSQLPALADAWELVLHVERSNAGLVLDSWHLDRGRDSAQALTRIAPGRVWSVQLNDPLPRPSADLREEARHRRQLPGPRAAAVLRSLTDIGVRARLCAEVWSDELESLSPRDAAQRVAFAMESVVTMAGVNDAQ